jgi:hypothetical protein
MDAMKQAIMKRRMKLAGDVDLEEMKDADLNPAEGSTDDLNIARDKQEMGEDGLAPDTAAQGNSGDVEMEIEMEKESPMQGMDDKSKIESFFAEDDLGKPGIRGKAAAKMMAALKKLKG